MSAQESPEYGAPPQIQKLHSMIGEWDIQFESRGGPEEPFKMYQSTSSIIPILKGAFLQEHFYLPTSSGQSLELVGLLGYDRYREIYRFAWLDEKYAIFDVHEGNWEGEALVVNNLRSATTFRSGDLEFYSRMIWREITADGFLLESDLSTDGGQTWFTQAKGRYLRKR